MGSLISIFTFKMDLGDAFEDDGFSPPAMSDDTEEAAALVARSTRIVLLTGAGISTDSGIPDFRGPNGLWTRNPGAEEASNIATYIESADARSACWSMQRDLQSCGPGGGAPRPNRGHEACAALEHTGRLRLLITQNVDGLHQAAGSTRVIEAHGGVHSVRCLGCNAVAPIGPTLERVAAGEADPHCAACGGILKPDAIFFGQPLPQEELRSAREAVETADLVVCVGSTLSVIPVNGLVPLARQCGAKVAIVNGGPTEGDRLADFKLTGSISELLPRLFGPACSEPHL